MRWIWAILVLLPGSLWAGTYTAATCSYANVNGLINNTGGSQQHLAVAGDVIVIPAGTCTWTSTLTYSVGITLIGSGTANTGTSTFGSGTLSTILVDDNTSGPIISITSLPYGQTAAIAMLDIEPNSNATALYSPVQAAGSCTSSGCPNLRIDNVGFGLTTPWTETGNSSNAATMIRLDNVFGVLDHNTQPSGSQVWFVNISHSAYLGVGATGDNSWAQADSFGTANNVFMENNLIYTTTSVSDAEFAPNGGGIGGGRVVGRYNHINATDSGFFVAFTFHGLDTDGRPQGGRSIEAYNNTINCANGSCGAGVAGFRSGTGIVFGNTLNANYPVTGGFYNEISDITVYRTVFTAGGGWGACGGSSAYDTNDGTVYYNSVTTSGSSGTTMNDSGQSWTTNQFIPNGAPYSVYDVTQGWWAEIASNTATSLTIQASIPEQTNSFNVGDTYHILRATICADQGGRGAGGYVSGSTPSPASALSQALDPIYEWDDTASNLNHGNIGTDTGRTIANRDWYTDGSNGSPQAQTSATSPFNGSSGVGFGTTARRPTSCTTGVGYFETDQGSQGELFVCVSTNTWGASPYYTPYTYPHPLTVAASSSGSIVAGVKMTGVVIH